jgi:hypothetical protein
VTTNTISMFDAEQMIHAHWAVDEPLMLLGSPGSGKTAMIERVARDGGGAFKDFRLTMRDGSEIGGMSVPDVKTGAMRWYCPEDLPNEKRDGERGIMLIDEINADIPRMIQAAAYGIINEGRIRGWTKPKGWLIVAAGNLVTDRAAATKMSTALANRFNVQVVKTDVDSWCRQYAFEHVDSRGVAFIRFRPQLLSVMPGETVTDTAGAAICQIGINDTAFPSARSWTKAFKFINHDPVLRHKIFTGYVGKAAASEFEAFWRVYSQIVSIEEMVADPLKARIPSLVQKDLSYALATMIGSALNRKNSEALFTYLGRLEPEFQVIAYQMAMKRDPSLVTAKGVTQWQLKNQEVLV